MSRVNLMGKRFGKLTVISQSVPHNGRTYWLCRCDCGNEKIVCARDLTSGHTTTCGCWRNVNKSPKFVDKIGNRYGKLTVLEYAYTKNGKSYWVCQCDCGKKKIINGSHLGTVVSCGCAKKEAGKKRRIDLTGTRVGRLSVMQPAYTKNDRRTVWKCLCDCGNVVYVDTSALVGKHTRSCGCLQRETAAEFIRRPEIVEACHKKVTKYKYGTHPAVSSWGAMMNRCYNPKNIMYMYYGAKGRTVCEEWHDRDKFVEWALANGWQKGLTIDRIDNNGNYEPGNCQWLSMSENSKKNIYSRIDIQIEDKVYCISDWAKVLKLHPKNLYNIRKAVGTEGLKEFIEQRYKIMNGGDNA